jgi:predicted RNA-binding Zn-ribbon protein involved in translation (DUF1610 family)
MSVFDVFSGGDDEEVECEHEIEEVEIGGRGVNDRNQVELGFTCPKCGERLAAYAELGVDE